MAMLAFGYVNSASMTRAERWAQEDRERKAREDNDTAPVLLLGYTPRNAGEAAGEAVSASLPDSSSSAED